MNLKSESSQFFLPGISPKSLAAICVACTLVMAGCGSTVPLSDSENAGSPALSREMNDLINNNQLPAGAKINNGLSLIMGAGDNWIGRVVMDLSQSPNAAYNFFLERYPTQGWTLVTAVRGKSSLLVFTKADRSASVEMSEGTFGATQATLTVTPKTTLPTNNPPASTPATSTNPVRR
jgi:hypothetical protein